MEGVNVVSGERWKPFCNGHPCVASIFRSIELTVHIGTVGTIAHSCQDTLRILRMNIDGAPIPLTEVIGTMQSRVASVFANIDGAIGVSVDSLQRRSTGRDLVYIFVESWSYRLPRFAPVW